MFTSTRSYENPFLFLEKSREKKDMRKKMGIDYSTFGAPMVGRSYQSVNYRYGFNGKENDPEANSTGSGTQDYGMRIYNPSLGRFLSVDPITKQYPELTPYQFSSNTPISCVDLDGLEKFFAADGSYLGQVGGSTTVKVVSTNDATTMRVSIEKFNNKDLSMDERMASWKYTQNNGKNLGITVEELYTRAFMSTLKQTENGGHDALPYSAKHGYSNGQVNKFTEKDFKDAPGDYKDHPYRGQKSSSGTAAGAYQILLPTYDLYKKAYPDIKDFSPEAQDMVIIHILKDTKALDYIKNNDLDNAVRQLVKPPVQFSSLPGGGQAHGMTMEKVRVLFKANLVLELNDKSDIATPKGKLLK